MNRLRIAVISTPIFKLPITGYGGLEEIAWRRAKGLAELGHQVTLYAPNDSVCPGVNIFPIGEQGKTSEEMAYSNYWKSLKDNYDVVIDDSWQAWSAVGRQEGWLKCPVLKVMHAPVHTMYQTLPPEKALSFVCISDDQRAHFEALFAPRKARTAHNGIDLDFYKSTRYPRSGRFLFLARFSLIKGPDIAIEACKKVGVGLDLIGDTTITNEPELLQKCFSMADEHQIRIWGNQSRAECVHWYSQAHCMLHPNKRFREPLGLAPLEAQACGVPVLTWDFGAMRETVRHGETGWLVNSDEEFVQKVKEFADPIPDSVRENCRNWAGNFSIVRMIKVYEKLCYEAIERPW